MAVPVTIERVDYDGWGYWPDVIHNGDIGVDFTAGYSKKKNRPDRRLTLFCRPGITDEQIDDELRKYARKKHITVIRINKIRRPETPEQKRIREKSGRTKKCAI